MTQLPPDVPPAGETQATRAASKPSRARQLPLELGRVGRALAAIPGAERLAAGLARIPLRSPTLPPATTTNHYLVGATGAVLVDPATPHRQSQSLLREVIGAWNAEVAPLHGIFLTHHHNDHIAAATTMARDLALPILAHRATAQLLAGRVTIDRLIADGEPVAWDSDGPWTAMHTPGHAPGHLILRGPDGGMIAGDMVAGQGTILIDPDDGDIGQYLESLALMREAAPPWLAPAHGPVLHQADETLQYYLSHRLAREARIYGALGEVAVAEDALLPIAYGDVSRRFWPLALRSMRAHLQYLHVQRRAQEARPRHWRRLTEA